MPRTMQQTKVTFQISQSVMDLAVVESEASQLNMAELIRRAVDEYLSTFLPPAFYEVDQVLPSQDERKVPIHINDGLLGELDRYALLVQQSADEVVNRSILLYMGLVQARRQAAEALDTPSPVEPDGQPEPPASLPEPATPDDEPADDEPEGDSVFVDEIEPLPAGYPGDRGGEPEGTFE